MKPHHHSAMLTESTRTTGAIGSSVIIVIHTGPEEGRGESSAHERPPGARDGPTRNEMVKLSKEQKAELEALEKLSDDELDLSDIPERPIDWSTAKIGMHYKPDWQGITLTAGPERRGLVRGTRREHRESPQGHQPGSDGTHPEGKAPERKTS